MEAERLEFSFANTHDGITQGLQAGGAYIGKSMPRRTHIRNGFWLVVIVAIVMLSINLLFYWLEDHPADTVVLASIALGAMAGVGVAMVLQVATVRHVSGRIAAAAGGQTHIIIDRDGVHERSGVGDFKFSWRAYDGVAESQKGLVIVFGGMLVMLPDEAFQNQMTREDMIAYVEEKAGQAAKTSPWS